MTTLVIGRSRTGNECVWCCRQFGVPVTPDTSSGICERHLAEMRAELAARRLFRYLDLLADVGCGG